jgi:hypothetical protein
MIACLQGTTFNSPNILSAEAFKDLHTIVGDNKIKATGPPTSTIDD